jgi:hypothetical protein
MKAITGAVCVPASYRAQTRQQRPAGSRTKAIVEMAKIDFTTLASQADAKREQPDPPSG